MSCSPAFWVAILLLFGAQARAADVEVHISTQAGVPVEDTAVALEPTAKTALKPRSMATVEQRDRELAPYVTVVQSGTAIDFPNRDAFKHHLYSFSPAKHFEIKLYVGKPVQPVIFDKAGEVALGCNVHDWMEAFVFVVDTPYFAKTGKDGRASVKNVPPGKYRLRLWHPRQKSEFALQEIAITSAPLKVDLTLDVTARVIKTKPPIEADQY